MLKPLPIHETFYTWQGEGVHMGKAAFFIRTYGCPVHCPWCDSAGTWHKDYIPDFINLESAANLASMAADTGAKIAVVTGGEPASHDLTNLVNELHKHGISAHLETSGGFKIKGDFDWITVSPKWARLPLPEVLGMANEYKFIITKPSEISEWKQEIDIVYNGNPIWLHPEWSQRSNQDVLKAISEAVKEYPAIYRAGYQLHKLYNVDALDPNSKPLVPLGGNPTLGY